jgi:ribosome-associated protein
MSIETRQQVAQAVRAVESKKGEDLAILEMDRTTGPFTDYFVVCTGTNPRQIQAISDEVERGLQSMGARPASIEGYNQAEWVLLDYVDFVVHIFSERARKFYDLERLWKSASRLTAADLLKKPAATKPAKRTAATRSAKAKSTAGPKAGSKRKKTPTTKKTAKRTIRKGKF